MTYKKQLGFSLLETMVSLAVLTVVGSIVMAGMGQLLRTQGSVANRTEMHGSVRSATELLQQEIGQAGRVALSSTGANVTLHGAVAGGTAAVSFTLDSDSTTAPSIYAGEVLTFDLGTNQETVTVATITGTPPTPSGTAVFTLAHAAQAPVAALGAFGAGIVPPATMCGPVNCGSTTTKLKLFGDINGDGNMMYVEYSCTGTATVPGNLYRNSMPITQATKAAVDNTMILLGNVLQNPNDAGGNPVPCFAYQVQTLGSGTCVTDVAVTLTVQTQSRDLQTNQFQTETKALLNVSPRNVVEVYDTASLVDPTRSQPIPASVLTLLP
jgi:prepilin-type N-terminal cleavage/methylation domain-containing protein